MLGKVQMWNVFNIRSVLLINGVEDRSIHMQHQKVGPKVAVSASDRHYRLEPHHHVGISQGSTLPVREGPQLSPSVFSSHPHTWTAELMSLLFLL